MTFLPFFTFINLTILPSLIWHFYHFSPSLIWHFTILFWLTFWLKLIWHFWPTLIWRVFKQVRLFWPKLEFLDSVDYGAEVSSISREFPSWRTCRHTMHLQAYVMVFNPAFKRTNQVPKFLLRKWKSMQAWQHDKWNVSRLSTAFLDTFIKW